MNQELLERVLASPRLPSLPAIALEIIDLVQQKDVNINRIAGTISHDPALTGKILKTVNSSFYGQAHTIGTISHALVVLGLNSVKTLALGFSLINHFKQAGGGQFDHFTLWKRCLYTGVAARHIARDIGLVQQEEAFLGGMMQDVGMLAMVQALVPDYAALLQEIGPAHRQLAAREREQFGMDHAVIGSALAQQWHLPPLLVNSIRHHESPDDAPPDVRPIVRCIALGGHVADVFIDADPQQAMDRLDHWNQQWFNHDRSDTSSLLNEVHKATVEMQRLFDLPTGKLSDSDYILSRANEALQQISLQQQMQARQLEQTNRQLVEQVQRDSLTGLANRGAFDATLAQEFAAATANRPLSLLFLDTDGFKSFNDTHGHQVGDQVLIEKAAVLQKAVPPSGMAARYGGEEFAVVLPATSRVEAAKLAESIRRRIAAMTIPGPDDVVLNVTISIGVATHDGSLFTNPAQFIKAADQGVYAAKRAGRNCVRVFAPREARAPA